MTETQEDRFESLTGIRAIAVIFILLLHSHFNCFRALWIGVPVFFVLSGFLITRILLKNKGAKNYFRAFFVRRSLRIFPIYYLVLFTTVLWGVVTQKDMSQLYYYVFYLQNFVISGGITPEFCDSVLRHTWSLSVEELFYLFWPVFVHFLSRTNLQRTCLVLGLGTVVFKTFYVLISYEQSNEPFLMLSLMGNMDSLMAGSFLGILSLGKKEVFKKWSSPPLFFLSLLLLCLSLIFNYTPIFTAKQAYLLKIILSFITALFSFFLISRLISASTKQSLFIQMLITPPLLFLGKISYGIYIYHHLVYRLVDSYLYRQSLSLHPFLTLFIQVLLTFVIAVFSWFFFEKHILNLKEKVNYRVV